ncbi:arabinose efflux permease family protein [Methyloglobulus morosus KoM1]|uniref:Arabinose efflux permease family protein n=2 Tax=Methyloglobulus TaxID=1410680 RepID=V5BXS5_9GAMM|nr:arabinose efflux permease family protein [Methyloglobulus morosus KoM1]
MTEIQDITSPMTPAERRATWSLASIYALRMLGLFLIMPVMSLFAEQMEGSTPSLIGLAIGIYGMSQAVLQIPFGLVSDRVGRKKIIVFGLLLFCLGSVIAAFSTSIYGVIVGRAVQGSGAIAGPTMALLADLTQEVHRTKAMALIGASIGISFGVAIAAGPVIAGFVGIHGLFWLIAVLSLLAILVIIFLVPQPQQLKKHRDAELVSSSFFQVLKEPELLRLNYGIFVLHAILTASFVVLPLLMRDAGLLPSDHWKVYLPVFVASFAVIIPFVILAEKKRKMKPVFLFAILILVLADLGLMQFNTTLFGIVGFLTLFFSGFNLLEATLPSLISKTAPGDMRGTAMGIYSTCQFLGAGIGGSLGGWCYGQYGAPAVFLLCALVALSWLLLSFSMKPPRYWANLLISLQSVTEQRADEFTLEMLKLKGVEDITLHYDEGVAYLKVDNQQLDRQELQLLITKYTQV